MLPLDEGEYARRVYAGVLGKIIGVYLGRPVEGWSHDRIQERHGTIRGYVNRPDRPVVVTDDDISGTFVLLRALADTGCDPEFSSAAIADAWLNYLVEDHTTLWWGGRGNCTEHTAYLNLLEGIEPPRSGSSRQNGEVLSQGIGAQIFIDGWAMVSPGDPERAADFAERAALVSHDGEAIHGARVVAAIESMAFVEPELNRLLDTAQRVIPSDCDVFRMIGDLRNWHAAESEWRVCRELMAQRYGYGRYPGNTPLVPNLAAIVLGLLYGQDQFSETLSVVNGCGWDTDCNSGNAGCIMGIRNGLNGIDEHWRGPVADRLYVTSAEPGSVVTDAATEAASIANMGRRLAGLAPWTPKQGARFHFSFPGSVQGFEVDGDEGRVACEHGMLSLRVNGGSPIRFSTPTFIPESDLNMPVYDLMGSPTLYPGETLFALIVADAENTAAVRVALHALVWNDDNEEILMTGTFARVSAGERRELDWRLPGDLVGPISRVGVTVEGADREPATVYLDRLGWHPGPETVLFDSRNDTKMSRNAWLRAVDFVPVRKPFRMVQNRGEGVMAQGARWWNNYRATARLKLDVVDAAGLGICFQGMRRGYVLLLSRDGSVRLEKRNGATEILASVAGTASLPGSRLLSLAADNGRICGWLERELLFDLHDTTPLDGGAISLHCVEGCTQIEEVTVKPWSAGDG